MCALSSCGLDTVHLSRAAGEQASAQSVAGHPSLCRFADLGTAAQGSEEDALQAGAPPGDLAPAWRVMLLSDGSVTRHLQLLTGLRVEVVRTLGCDMSSC